MTAEEVLRIVLTAIDDQWDRWTAHSLDLRRSVVRPPRLETYVSATRDGTIPLKLWLVIEEDPDTHAGYEVFYDPEDDVYGLGSVDAHGERHYIGDYGSLWKTLESM